MSKNIHYTQEWLLYTALPNYTVMSFLMQYYEIVKKKKIKSNKSK